MSEHVERALAEAYALGALDPPERKLFETHLGSCRICRESVGGAAVAVNAIALTAPKETPPKGSGDRLLALYREQKDSMPQPPARGNNLGNTLATVFAIVGLGAAGWGFHAHDQVHELERKVDDLEKKSNDLEKKASDLAKQVDLCHFEKEKEILAAADVKRYEKFKPNADWTGGADVKIAYSPSKGVVVDARNLPQPPPGKCYKLWSIAGGKVSKMSPFQPGIFIDNSPGGADTKFAISEEDDPSVEVAKRVILLPA